MPSRRWLPATNACSYGAMSALRGRVALLALVPFLASWTPIAGMGGKGGPERRPPPDDGLVCAGRFVMVGNPLDQVLEKCGPPARADQQCDSSGHHCNGTWTYRPDNGSFPRYVGFIDDTVRSIQAGSRFD